MMQSDQSYKLILLNDNFPFTIVESKKVTLRVNTILDSLGLDRSMEKDIFMILIQ